MVQRGKEIYKLMERGEELLGDGWIRNPEYSETPPAKCRGKLVHVPGMCDVIIQDIIAAITHAKQMICVSSFIIEYTDILGALNEAERRGVNLYVLTAAENQLKEPTEYLDENYIEKAERTQEYKFMLASLSRMALIRTGGMLHSKFILIDPSTNPVGFLLTSNLTERALRENKELVLRLSPIRTRELLDQFKEGFWGLADKQLLEKSSKGFDLTPVTARSLNPLNDTGQLIYQLGKAGNIKNYLLSAIERAKDSIDISAWTFSESHKVSETILTKVRGGLKARIFVHPSAKNVPFLKDAFLAGARIYSHRLMHAKSVMVDGNAGAIFTANIDGKGLDDGFESGFKLEMEEIRELSNLYDLWAMECDLTFKSEVKVRDALYGALVIRGSKLEKVMIEPGTKEVSHGEIETESMEEYISDSWYPSIKPSAPISMIERHSWTKFPPKLPNGSSRYQEKNVKEEEGLRLFADKNGRKYVQIQSLDYYEKALPIASRISAKIVI